MKLRLIAALALVLAFTSVQTAKGQFYIADAATYGNLSISSDYAAKLFTGTQASPGPPVPDGTVLWFVASVDNVFNSGGDFGGQGPGGFLTADDTLLFSIGVNGVANGGPQGSLIRDSDNASAMLNIPVANSPKNIHVYLWGGPNSTGNPSAFVPGPGNTWGELSLGVRPDPNTPGQNANWIWNIPIYSGTIGVIPEPSTLALAGLGVVGLFGYRRFTN